MSTKTKREFTQDDYRIGWISALTLEATAAVALLDERHPKLDQHPNDSNAYTFGRVGKHNVVIGRLPTGIMGESAATAVAKDMLRSFPNIRFGLMVGIGGGVPGPPTENPDSDIRLGDLVVSKPGIKNSGVVQYDYGKTLGGGNFIETGHLNKPPNVLLAALGELETEHDLRGSAVPRYISEMIKKYPKKSDEWRYPGSDKDNLCKEDHGHTDIEKSCDELLCMHDKERLVTRKTRSTAEPIVHYGLIASGNQVMRDAFTREKLRKQHGMLCFEMEAAGLMDHFPCLVIRGICDYSDSHKNKVWQSYAAAVAAAFAKDLLQYIAPPQVDKTEKATSVLERMEGRLERWVETAERVESKVNVAEEQVMLDWYFNAPISNMYHKSLGDRTNGTGQWLLNSDPYKDWRDYPGGLLWLYGAAGCGKTVLCSTVIENIQNSSGKHAYWQLSQSPPLDSTRRLWEKHNKAGSHPSLNELSVVLHEIIDHYQDVFIVIDALDECPQTSDRPERKTLLGCIDAYSSRHKNNLHMLVTSRLEHDIKSMLKPRAFMKIEDFLDDDIVTFVRDKFDSGSLAEYHPDIISKIETSLLSVKERRFRWVDLQIRRLTDCNTEDQIDSALRTIPETLEATYKETLDNIPHKDKDHARQILMWLCGSFRPMTPHEIAEAVGLLSPERAQRICTSMLVTLIHENTRETMQLAHFTVKEYLLQKQIQVDSQFKFSDELAQAALADRTVNYLLETNKLSESIDLSKKYLLEYSARFWYRHARSVIEKDGHCQLLELIDRLFSPGYSTSYMNWLQTYDCDDKWYGTVTKTEYAQPLYYAALLGFSKCVTKLLKGGAIVKKEGSTGNAFLAATSTGYSSIVKDILGYVSELGEAEFCLAINLIKDNAWDITQIYLEAYKFKITERVVKSAAENEESGEAVMTLLLDRKGDVVKISEEVVNAAVGNGRSGEAVMTLLLDRKGDDIKITQRVVKAAAENGGSGEAVMALLLDRKGEDIKISEEVVKAAAGNEESGEAVMTVLLNRKGDDIKITEIVVKAAAGNGLSGKAVMSVLLDRKGGDIKISKEVVEAAAGNEESGEAVMTLLLNRKGEDIKITERVVKAAAENGGSGEAVMALLLDRKGEDIKISEEVVKAAAGNEESGEAVMTVLLNRKGDDIKITEIVVKAAAGNGLSGKAVMSVLLDRKGGDIKISKEVVEAAAGNEESGEAVMTLLLNRKGEDIKINENAVAEIARRFDSRVMTLLLDRKGGDIKISEEAAAEIARRFDSRVMTLLLDRKGDDIKISGNVVKAAAGNWWSSEEVMTVLLNRKGDGIKISEEAVAEIARIFDSGVMTLLLDRKGGDIKISEEVVKAAAGNRRSGEAVVTLLLDRKEDEEEAVAEIARRFDSRVMTLLLDRKGEDIKISGNVVKAAAGSWWSGEEVMTVLLNRKGEDIKISEEAVAEIAWRFDSRVMALLLDRKGEDIKIGEKVVKAAAESAESGEAVMTLLLDRKEDEVKISEETVNKQSNRQQEKLGTVVDSQSLGNSSLGSPKRKMTPDIASYGNPTRKRAKME